MRAPLILAAALIGPSCAASAATVVNGGFEANTATGAPFDVVSAGSDAIEGWTVESGSVDLIGTYWQPSEGSYSLDMSGDEPASISTTVAGLIVGRTYVVEFDVSGNPDGGDAVKALLLTLDEDVTYEYDVVEQGTTRAEMKWETYRYSFTASDVTALLGFASLEANPYGMALDDVRVALAAVPVPASLGLLALALGGLAAARRRR